MPNICRHTFSHASAIGLKSIASNVEAARVAKEAGDLHDQLHAMDYEVYAYLQLGQDEKAKATIDEMMTVTGLTGTYLPNLCRCACAAATWSSAATGRPRRTSRSVRPLAPCAGDFPFCPRAGAARSGDPRGRQG